MVEVTLYGYDDKLVFFITRKNPPPPPISQLNVNSVVHQLGKISHLNVFGKVHLLASERARWTLSQHGTE